MACRIWVSMLVISNGIEHRSGCCPNVNPVVHDPWLWTESVSGVGSVLSFLPTIVTLFFFLSILEDTGYMARVAFVMDKLLRKSGTVRPKLRADAGRIRMFRSGGHGDAERLSSERDRKMTILLDSVYELQCKIADLRTVYDQCIFPETVREVW